MLFIVSVFGAQRGRARGVDILLLLAEAIAALAVVGRERQRVELRDERVFLRRRDFLLVRLAVVRRVHHVPVVLMVLDHDVPRDR